MNQMNQMNLNHRDWASLLRNKAEKQQVVGCWLILTIFCVFLGVKSGSFMFIWFIGLVLTCLLLYFNEPNVHECSKGCGMRVYALSVLGGESGQKSKIFGHVFDRLDVLDSDAMYIKFIRA